MYPHISSLLHLPPSYPPYPTPLGGHKAPSWSPCAMRLLPTSYLFYIWSCIYVHATLSLCPSLPFPLPVSSSPFSSRSASLFLSCPYVLHDHFFGLFFRFHVYVLAYGICYSLSDLLHSVWQTLGPSTSLQITQFHFFLWLSNIPLYICATSSLCIHL